MVAREDYPDAWLWQGDVNGDGVIDIYDITAIALNYKKPASVAPECDLDGDGWISMLDLEKAERNFGLTYEVWVKQLEGRFGSMVMGTALLFLPFAFLGGEALGRRVT